MKPDFELHLGDCLEVMKSMENDSVDIVFTSPPYNVGLKYSEYDDNKDWDEYLEFLVDVYAEIFRVLSDSGRVYSVLSDRLMFVLKEKLEKIGFMFGQLLTWCKPNLCGGSGKITGDWNYLTEQILLMRKGKVTKMLKGDANTHSYFIVPTPQSNYSEGRFHPAQFPIKLPDLIISRTPGQIVFDPFMGSGSTGIAAIRNGRSFVGIEIDEKYYRIAKTRIDKEIEQPKLFRNSEVENVRLFPLH